MESIWQSVTEMPSFPELEGDKKADVAVIGGGIAGILTAHMLKARGIDCLLLEKGRICNGTTILDVRYTDENGAEVDFATLVLTEDAIFTAKARKGTVYYTISYWYYNESETAIYQGETYRFAVGSGDSVPATDIEAIEQAIESATVKTVINWKAIVSEDGLTIAWYA